MAASVNVPASTTEFITFTAVQPVGVPATAPATGTVGIPMQVAISNLRQTVSSNDTADIVVSYGTTVETYRKVVITDIVTALQGSNLVTVTLSATPPAEYPTTTSPLSLGYGVTARGGVDRHQPARLRGGVRGLRLAG